MADRARRGYALLTREWRSMQRPQNVCVILGSVFYAASLDGVALAPHVVATPQHGEVLLHRFEPARQVRPSVSG